MAKKHFVFFGLRRKTEILVTKDGGLTQVRRRSASDAAGESKSKAKVRKGDGKGKDKGKGDTQRPPREGAGKQSSNSAIKRHHNSRERSKSRARGGEVSQRKQQKQRQSSSDRKRSHSENRKTLLNPFFPPSSKPRARSQAAKPSSSSSTATSFIKKKPPSKKQPQPLPRPAKSKSQPTSAQSKSKPNSKLKAEPEPEPVSCIICLTDYPPRQTTLLPCKHRICNACIQRAFELSMRDPQHMPPCCCSTTQEIPARAVSHLFTPAFLARWRQRRRELAISPQKRLYCPARGCNARNGGSQTWIPPENIRPSQSAPSRRKATCPRCQARVCADCGRLWHGKQPCSTGANKQDEEKEREAFAALARDHGWKRCVGCAAMVERREGCNHMTCRCGAEFCMACGAQWKTCECPLFPPVTLTTLPELGLGVGAGEGEGGRRPIVDPILYLIDDFEDDDDDDQSEGEGEQRAGFWDEHGNWYSWTEVQARTGR